ncbi:MAG: NAD-binding protein [Planctomycetes bacterium]|nr:NAD-binding protein [Planctomycetota bacterium]
MTKFASKVTVVHRRDQFRASKIMQDRIFNNSKVDIRWNATVADLLGDPQNGGLKAVVLKDTLNGDLEEIPIDAVLAESMREKIQSQIDAGAGFLVPTFAGLSGLLSPSVHKGRDGKFTCIGLIEWAAEQAGHNGGKGFIPNHFESIIFPPGLEVPLLSPQLLNYI